jgi:hypothetical protein
VSLKPSARFPDSIRRVAAAWGWIVMSARETLGAVGLAQVVDARSPDLVDPPVGDPDLTLLRERHYRLVEIRPGIVLPRSLQEVRLAGIGVEGLELLAVHGRVLDRAHSFCGS